MADGPRAGGAAAADAEADRMHAALLRSFELLVPQIEGATFDPRDGYVVAECASVPLPLFNGIWVEGPDGAAVVREVSAAVAGLEARHPPCWIVLRPERTPGLLEASRGMGFTEQGSLPAMVAAPAELTHEVGRRDPAIEIDLARDERALAEAIGLVADGFGLPREVAAPMLTRDVAGIPGLTIEVVRSHGRPVSTATALSVDGTVGIFNVATPPADRGRGYASVATLRAAHAAFAAGADLAWLQASPMGEPVYRRLGFRQVGTYVVMGRPPDGP